MDHEFDAPADLEQEVVGWDWFSLQLSDKRDLMLFYQLCSGRRSAGRRSSGTIIKRLTGRRHFLKSLRLVSAASCI